MTYTSPSGATFELMFDDVNRTGGKKAVIVEPPQQNRAVVQDLGNLGIRFALSVYIAGQDYHTTADKFFVALSEPCDSDNPATLSHPRWGDILVCPTGGFTQTENFVDGMGQAAFAFELVRVDRAAKFPANSTDAGGQLQADADAATTTGINAYADAGAPTDPTESVAVSASASDFATAVGDNLRGLASQISDLSTQFEADLAEFLSTVDTLVSAPEELAIALTSLITSVASAPLVIEDKVAAYAALADSLATMTTNSFAECELMLVACLGTATAVSTATLEGDLLTRQQAINSADDIDDILAKMRADIEAAELTGWIADPDSVAALTDVLSQARTRLIAESFDLKSERRYTFASPIDPNSAVKFLYGTWSEELLDQFGADNALEDDEWFMLPPGFEAVWYA